MITAGVDVGSATAKAVILNDNGIGSWKIIPTGADSTKVAEQVMQAVLDSSNLSMREVKYIISTGYGRANVAFGQKTISEISCHARGAVWFFPEVRTILDMGGQDLKVIRCNEKGEVLNFLMNDKCAAGTGRYLERIANCLGVSIEQIGPLSFQTVEGPVAISSTCAVFAEADVISLLRQGREINDILAGVCEALCDRLESQLKRLGVVEDFSICGGIAKNIGIVKRLEDRLRLPAYIPFEPQIVGAVGAASFAREEALKNS